MNQISKNIKILVSIQYILMLIMIFIICYQYTHPKTFNEDDFEVKFIADWYCMDGVYNTMKLYEIKYNISKNRNDYDFLSIELCGGQIFGNISNVDAVSLINEYSKK